MPSTSSNLTQEKDDGLGFDVDELMKKIDAKIAALEEEERQNEAKAKVGSPKIESSQVEQRFGENETTSLKSDIKEQESKEEKEKATSVTDNLVIDYDDDDDEFFDDFFDN